MHGTAFTKEYCLAATLGELSALTLLSIAESYLLPKQSPAFPGSLWAKWHSSLLCRN